jgi:hypothetical protein
MNPFGGFISAPLGFPISFPTPKVEVRLRGLSITTY